MEMPESDESADRRRTESESKLDFLDRSKKVKEMSPFQSFSSDFETTDWDVSRAACA